ncbi:chromosome segregation protein SMC [Roseimaritima ulvae]|uniref:Chromosome partition protein Smc n=1 Tax=Roseimaritima ulvae TaxID=980254 RepID=A0A5B9QUX0_9BACT|nr:chromosome segregation protein SMC [Roseimaritima ulvae]QEG41769.1 Chromosome partition protein Smc [Roseimaritima ulvae]
MLKALEIAGFKSFADRTRFDFPDGITVVVGPNGSGKSNIVDAIKWVLGSQSAKSLRGKEMADVIFKGSQSRGPAGSAEATIVFDNSEGNLPIEAPEVHVTRRVFRSGEGEYLINNQPCRLKDIKSLIAGTGIGIDAYSLIEQGKVDRMLQANAKDRRVIFEEAAGISRFKAKKVEAERRLARVDQNLVRLGDIVDEVASRLQSLKSQASKAERYRQGSERLRQLRTSLAWTDWSEMSEQLQQAETDLNRVTELAASEQARREQIATQRQEFELSLQTLAEQARTVEAERSDISRDIAGLAGRRDADAVSLDELETTLEKGRRRVRLLQSQAGSAAAEYRDLRERLRNYQTEYEAAQAAVDAADAVRQQANTDAEEARSRRAELQVQHLAALRTVADLDGHVQRLQQQLAQSTRTAESLSLRRAAGQASVAEAQAELKTCRQVLHQLNTSIAASEKQIELARAELNDKHRLLSRRREEIAALNVRLQGLTERQNVLQDLEKRQEGIQTGVRSLMDQVRDARSEVLSDVLGLVADHVETDPAVAPLIDATLGPLAQYAIVRGDRVQNAVLAGEIAITGRVGLLRIDELPPRRPGDKIRLEGLGGVIGRADRMVHTDAQFEPLVRHLLGTTWIVDSLATALGLRKLSGAGLRFVTSNCELLDRDGSIIVGPATAAAGLVSRHSQLAATTKDIQHYRYQLSEAVEEAERLSQRVDQDAAGVGRVEDAHREAVTQRAAAEASLRHAEERLQSRAKALAEIDEEIESTSQLHSDAATQQAQYEKQLSECRAEIQAIETAAADSDQQLEAKENELRLATDHVMAISVDVARAEQKVEALTATLEQQRRDQSQRQAAVEEVRGQLQKDSQRRDELRLRQLNASDALATYYLRLEASEQQMKSLAAEATAMRDSQRKLQRELDAASSAANKASQEVHAISSRRDTVRMKRETLADRLLEDYEIDLRGSEPPEDHEPPEDREAAEAEITKLREQLQRVGSVNMEALDELEGLQTRYDELHSQYQDLTAAKDSLQRVIQRINTDSRRLFMDTLEAIRQNFQRLYRKSFGGGQADLILEESDDPLEAGVEIVATPPGKPSFSNSLLSGGEKALTAVALLMSIFQYRPSPFCVLDEVDAPFDEANIGRFVTVLKEFLDQSKFVVVTHSKKTMTAATTLYGVTMQESGVSKRVSVRFEDVNEDGEINNTDAA